LVVVGGESELPSTETTPEIGRLRELAQGLGIDDHIIFTGRRDRGLLRYFYSASDVFVTTPWYEPFGITPLESMACGTPVIGADVGGIKYTVVDGVTGYLVPPNDPVSLAQRLETLLDSDDLLRTMGTRAIQRAHANFTWGKVVAAIGRVYSELLDEETSLVRDFHVADITSQGLSTPPMEALP
jgi:glycosyltransferase involved in cell wall biosynthesis